jgi:hypothetical protein
VTSAITTSAVKTPAEPPRQSGFSVLAPSFAIRLWLGIRAANKEGLRVGLFESLRTNERQEWLWQQGRSRPGSIVTNARTSLTSWHGYGLAGDLAFLSSRGEWFWPDTSDQRWEEVRAVLARFDLTTGLSWKSKDAPHAQPAKLPATPTSSHRQILEGRGIVALWDSLDMITLGTNTLKYVELAA